MAITWQELCQLEPALVALEQKTRQLQIDHLLQNPNGHDAIWYEQIKPELCKLVGHERPVPGSPVIEHGEGLIHIGVYFDKEYEAAQAAAFAKIPPALRVLHDSEAYKVVYDYLLDLVYGEAAANN